MSEEAVKNEEFNPDEKIDLEIPKDAFEFIKNISMRIEIAGGGTYMYLPFWMEIKDEAKCRILFHDFDHLPGELKGALMEMRLTTPNTDQNESTGEGDTDSAGK